MSKKTTSPKGETLRGLVMAQHPDGLAAVRAALAGDVGLRAGSKTLGVSVSYLRKRAARWPALAQVIADGAMSLHKRASVAGAAYAARCAREAGG